MSEATKGAWKPYLLFRSGPFHAQLLGTIHGILYICIYAVVYGSKTLRQVSVCNKTPDRSNLMKELFVLAHALKEPCDGKSWWQNLEAASYN